MCNLYSMTKNQAAIRDLFKIGRDTTGNLPPLPAIFPDQMAPVVRVSEGERELIMMRWGMPNPPQYPGITTNIRNTNSPHWRRWLGAESRCLVPEERPLNVIHGNDRFTKFNKARGNSPDRS